MDFAGKNSTEVESFERQILRLSFRSGEVVCSLVNEK